jgi:hypothetical protein
LIRPSAANRFNRIKDALIAAHDQYTRHAVIVCEQTMCATTTSIVNLSANELSSTDIWGRPIPVELQIGNGDLTAGKAGLSSLPAPLRQLF